MILISLQKLQIHMKYMICDAWYVTLKKNIYIFFFNIFKTRTKNPLKQRISPVDGYIDSKEEVLQTYGNTEEQDEEEKTV